MNKILLVIVILLCYISTNAQVGIGTNMPDPSSILDIYSQNKGLLMPRLTTTQRDSIIDPSKGLMIYNTTLNDCQVNVGESTLPIWTGTNTKINLTTNSVNEGDDVSSTSITNLLIPGMIVLPQKGNYIVLFNAHQKSSAGDQQFFSDQGVIDVDLIYQDLISVTGGVPHGLIFGNNEVLYPGVYDVGGAASIAGTLTLDGGTDVDPVFIIRSAGAFTSGANTTVILAGNADPRNIFWVSEGAVSAGADSINSGTLVSRAGGMSLGAGASLEGRLLTKSGAISIGANSVLNVPTGESFINLRILSSFAMFTTIGAVSDTATSVTTGDVGTASGALTMAGTHNGEEYPAGTTLESAATANNTTYSIYQNGIEIVNSSRTIFTIDSALVSLQTMITSLTDSDVIEIRWKVDEGESTIGNRDLSLIHF
ncbi:MAG: ice-binding family protein [Nonlabens sp.]|jgi:hypothetical protein|uniref:ice-binding family protein n=1 Tax=Nonlabens sp. TaxID=1888209 RepID=UPI0035A623CB